MITSKNFFLSFSIIILFMVISACSTTPPQHSDALSLSSPRFGHAAINDGKKIFVFAGSNKSGFLSDVEIIDPVSGKIQVLNNKVIPRLYFSAVWDGKDSVYIIGGLSVKDKKLQFEQRVEVFNTVTHEVSFASSIPTPTRINSAVILSDRIYVFGGTYRTWHGLKASSQVSVFSIAENKWMQAADMPTAKATRAVVNEGKIYVVGGYDQIASMDSFEMYDPKENTWQTLPPMPVGISAHSLTLVNDRIYVFGNYHDLKSTYSYNFLTNQWQKVELGYQASRHNAVTTLNNTTYVIGGNTGSRGPFLDSIQEFNL